MNSTNSKAPATLDTLAKGAARHSWQVEVGQYVWHRGAFRRVTSIRGTTLRMGNYYLGVGVGNTVEVSV